MILFLLVVTATFRPPAPTVGDPITVQFAESVVLDPSDAYEVVSHDGGTVVVRTFRPEPFELSGRAGEVFFRRLIVPVTSVLAEDDSMEPAPLAPPAAPVASRRPLIAIAAAAAVATLAWLAAVLLARRAERAAPVVPELPAAERYRLAIEALRRDPSRTGRWASLADATRRYLASTEQDMGLELTTSELLRVARRESVATILRQGDLEKFSPWGARALDFDVVANDALTLVPPPAAAEEAA